MTQLSISKAAETFGVARSTIQRKIRNGELSCSVAGQGSQPNAKSIDISELIRVFGEPSRQSATSNNKTATNSIRQQQSSSSLHLKMALKLLENVRDENKFLKQQIEEKDKLINTQMKLFSNMLEKK